MQLKLYAQRNETETKQCQNIFETFLKQFRNCFVSVSFRCADSSTNELFALKRHFHLTRFLTEFGVAMDKQVIYLLNAVTDHGRCPTRNVTSSSVTWSSIVEIRRGCTDTIFRGIRFWPYDMKSTNYQSAYFAAKCGNRFHIVRGACSFTVVFAALSWGAISRLHLQLLSRLWRRGVARPVNRHAQDAFCVSNKSFVHFTQLNRN